MVEKNLHKKTGNTAILLIHCPDRKGIVAAVTTFIHQHEGNIVYLDQHVDPEEQVFFMRIEWELDHFKLAIDQIACEFEKSIAGKYAMTWNVHFSWEQPRMAVFISKLSHCLFDILSRYQAEEWKVEIPLIISNHPNLESVASRFGIDFYCIPKNKETRLEKEKEEMKLLKRYGIDFIVLARYMQILSPQFVNEYTNRIINIHHSFLPAFPGGKPYHSAYARGVKIIGATSHYVTADLDAGPIIEQDVSRVTHRDSVQEMIRIGRDLEKIVLSRAIHAHINRKILVYKNRTIVFS